jgi:hypothetical protein
LYLNTDLLGRDYSTQLQVPTHRHMSKGLGLDSQYLPAHARLGYIQWFKACIADVNIYCPLSSGGKSIQLSYLSKSKNTSIEND